MQHQSNRLVRATAGRGLPQQLVNLVPHEVDLAHRRLRAVDQHQEHLARVFGLQEVLDGLDQLWLARELEEVEHRHRPVLADDLLELLSRGCVVALQRQHRGTRASVDHVATRLVAGDLTQQGSQAEVLLLPLEVELQQAGWQARRMLEQVLGDDDLHELHDQLLQHALCEQREAHLALGLALGLQQHVACASLRISPDAPNRLQRSLLRRKLRLDSGPKGLVGTFSADRLDHVRFLLPSREQGKQRRLDGLGGRKAIEAAKAEPEHEVLHVSDELLRLEQLA